MRILTWNINGVRTLPQYHPWNTFKCHDEILDKLGADIICFQEMKTSRAALPKSVGLPPSYDSFFSFPVKKSGYSGVATYTRSATVIPVKAEEGLMGLVQPKPPLAPEERVSRFENYPPQFIDDDGDESVDFKHLDSEGRALIIDFGLFVLINVYCPNDGTGTAERDKFKMDYHRLLDARVRRLIEREGREVIVLGDINACAAVIDHCEGNILVARGKAAGLEGEDGFWEKEYRKWLRDWLRKEDGTGGPLIDVVRRCWPERKGMYTCWNTKISARETNYGTRIDYILITPGLLPWIKTADVQQEVKGSDHCPVFVDLHDEITTKEGTVIKLQDVLGSGLKSDKAKEPPRLAAKFWEEYSGKQMSLDKFFGKTRGIADEVPSIPPTVQSPRKADSTSDPPSKSPTPPIIASSTADAPSHVDDTQPAAPTCSTSTTSVVVQSPAPAATTSQPLKRKLTFDNKPISKKPRPFEKKLEKAKNESGQSKLSSFFNKPSAPQTPTSTTSRKMKPSQSQVNVFDVDADDDIPVLLEELEPSSQGSLSGKSNGEGAKQAWSTLLAPVEPPKCIVHGEPAKEYTVNKQGPNKGKKFFICSRSVGPGYDKGRAERLREEVNPTYRCNFFKWSSDWRKQAKKLEQTASNSTPRSKPP